MHYLTAVSACLWVTYESILQLLREAFQEVVPQEKGKDELWHHALEKFLGAVFIRRECQVKNWILATQ
jgi:hypothetical protein